jgi:hypothetical protein
MRSSDESAHRSAVNFHRDRRLSDMAVLSIRRPKAIANPHSRRLVMLRATNIFMEDCDAEISDCGYVFAVISPLVVAQNTLSLRSRLPKQQS